MTTIPVRTADNLALIGHIETNISQEQAAYQGHISVHVYPSASVSARLPTGISQGTCITRSTMRLPVQSVMVYGSRWTAVVVDNPRYVLDLPGFLLDPQQRRLLCSLTTDLMLTDRAFLMATAYSADPWDYLKRHAPSRVPEVLERWVDRIAHPEFMGVDRASGPDRSAVWYGTHGYAVSISPPTVDEMVRDVDLAEMMSRTYRQSRFSSETPNRSGEPKAARVTTTRAYIRVVRALELEE